MQKMQVLRGVVPPVFVMAILAGLVRPTRAAQTFSNWSAPTPVTTLNTAANDEYAVLSKDELTIYFTSDRPGSQRRTDGTFSLDLWFATRDSVDSPWSEPQNMGPQINSAADDSLPFLSPNEHVLYFYSRRQAGSCGVPASGTGDIWMTDVGTSIRIGKNRPTWDAFSIHHLSTKRLRRSSRIRKPNNPGFFSAVTALGRVPSLALAGLVTTMSMQALWAKMGPWGQEYWFPNSAAQHATRESSSGKTAWRRSSRAIGQAA